MDGVDGAESVIVGAVLFIACILLSLVVIGMLWNREAGWAPGPAVPDIVAVAARGSALVLHLRGNVGGS